MSDVPLNAAPVLVSSRHLAPDSLLAALFLAFLATAGLFYVNLGGAFLSAFVDGIGLSREEAGYVTSANKYGAAFGALLAVSLIKRVHWRKTAMIALPALITIDAISFTINETAFLIAIRSLHGVIGGFLVGMGLSVIARLKSPEKGYGVLLAVQYCFGSLGIFIVPKLVGSLGPGAAFGALIVFSVITLAMVPFIPEFPPRAKRVRSTTQQVSESIKWGPLGITLFAIFLFQAANMGLADYMLELGKDSGYTMGQLSNWLASAGLIAVSGAILVYAIGTRYGRTLPLIIGVTVSAACSFAFHWSDNVFVFFLANTVTGMCWAFCVSYLLGLAAAFDRHGQMASLGGFISKMGLASGPMIGALVIGDGNFQLIINIAAGALLVCALLTLIPALHLDRADTLMETQS